MPEYYLDEEWNMVKAPMTTQDLASWANFFQKKYFPDVEADVQVGINTNSKFQGAACFEPERMMIHIAQAITPFENMAKIALLHEMVHVKLQLLFNKEDADHGKAFKSEIKRLIEAGAYDSLL
ncbi:MAG: SprT-like domain-containing protein [Candidatus Korobacteraceae bacterium]